MTSGETSQSNRADCELAGRLASAAGELLLQVRSDWTDGDRRDLGRTGDLESNRLILAGLHESRPEDAVLSEESADDPGRLTAERVWIVDPLDGTREFTMPGRDDWAVHVALWEHGRGITAAAVAVPALRNRVYVSGAASAEEPDRSRSGPLIVVSDSRAPAVAAAVAADVGGEIVPMGSAGAKAMAVLRGDVDAYIHAGGQWEWDSAAPVGVLLSAGMHASRLDGSPLEYNRPNPYLPDLLMCSADLAPKLLGSLRQAMG